MRVSNTEEVVPVVKDLVKRACFELDGGFIGSLKDACENEESPLGKEILDTIIKNANFAKNEGVATCQDTGVTVVYLEIGQEVSWEGKGLIDMINEGVRQGYREGYLRNSVVSDPILRENTNDNTPAVIRTEIVPGDKVSITVMPKGAGSENMSRVAMLTPADGVEGVKRFVLETVELAGGKACPPLIVGIGLGGTMDMAPWLAKKALLRSVGYENSKEHLSILEKELLKDINDLGIGPLGVGGRVTALDVHIETYPCHIASLPIAVNLQCHANRHAHATL